MNISITARKFKAHKTLRNHIEDEVKSLKKYYDDILNAEVIMSYQNTKDSLKITEIILQVPGQILKASQESDDFAKSVTGSVEKLGRQLVKLKSKKISRNK